MQHYNFSNSNLDSSEHLKSLSITPASISSLTITNILIVVALCCSPPVAPRRRLEEQGSDNGLPQVVKCEIAQLANKFTISHNNDDNVESKRMTLVCSISEYA